MRVCTHTHTHIDCLRVTWWSHFCKSTELIISLFSEQFAITGTVSIISGKKSNKPFVSMRTIDS